MTSLEPGGAMVRKLILKDFYFQREFLVVVLVAGLASLLLLGSGSEAGFYAGTVLLVTVMIGHGAYLAMDSVIQEKEQQTLAFVLSLPLSLREYVQSKIFGSLLIFGISWSLLTVGAVAVLWARPDIPNGLIPIAVILLTEIFLSTSLILAVALLTRSMAWSISAIVVGNLAFNGFMFFVARLPSIESTMEGPAAVWHRDIILLLGAEVAVIIAAMSATYFIAARRKDCI